MRRGICFKPVRYVVLAALLATLLATKHRGVHGVFVEKTPIDTLRGPMGIAVADMDNDHMQDVVYLGQPPFHISIAWQKEHATSSSTSSTVPVDSSVDPEWAMTTVVSESTAGVGTMVVTDVDLDGWLDIVYSTSRKLTWLRNTKAGTFTAMQSVALPTYCSKPSAMAAAPLRPQISSFPDVVLCCFTNVLLLRNQGNGSFATYTDLGVLSHSQRAVQLADMDGDGLTDIVFAHDSSVSWKRQLVHGNFTAYTRIIPCGNVFGMYVGRLDEHGCGNDIAATCGGSLVVLRNQLCQQSSAAFAPEVRYPCQTCSAVVGGDWTGTGSIDLATPGGQGMNIFHNSGTGDLQLAQQLAVGSTGSLAVGDMNADHTVDLVYASSGQATVLWLANLDSSYFLSRVLVGTVSKLSAIVAADFHTNFSRTMHRPQATDRGNAAASLLRAHPPLLDIVLTGLQSRLTKWFNQSGVLCPWLIPSSSGSPFITQPALPGALGGAVVAADISGDGALDLVIGSIIGSSLVWVENTMQPGNTFLQQPHIISQSSGGVFCIVSADWDGDGDLDLLTGSLGYNALVLYENLGRGHAWNTHSTVFPQRDSLPVAMAAAHVNADKHVDVVVVLYQANRLVYYVNNGTGEFTLGGDILGAEGPAVVAVGDLLGRSSMLTDVVWGSAARNEIGWARNDGGTFTSMGTIATGVAAPRGVACADIDGDGLLDIVWTATRNTGWAHNRGQGQFTVMSPVTQSSLVTTLFVGDVWGRGVNDVILGEGSNAYVFPAKDHSITIPIKQWTHANVTSAAMGPLLASPYAALPGLNPYTMLPTPRLIRLQHDGRALTLHQPWTLGLSVSSHATRVVVQFPAQTETLVVYCCLRDEFYGRGCVNILGSTIVRLQGGALDVRPCPTRLVQTGSALVFTPGTPVLRWSPPCVLAGAVAACTSYTASLAPRLAHCQLCSTSTVLPVTPPHAVLSVADFQLGSDNPTGAVALFAAGTAGPSFAIHTDSELLVRVVNCSGPQGAVSLHQCGGLSLRHWEVAHSTSTGPTAGGAFTVLDSVLTLTNCSVHDNTATRSNGGAIAVTGRASLLTLRYVALHNNTALQGCGGAVALTGSFAATHVLDAVHAFGNAAVQGGGGFGCLTTVSARIQHSVIEYCRAGRGSGGALRVQNAATLSLQGSRLQYNSAAGSGGAVAVVFSTASLHLNYLFDNNAVVGGGAVYCEGSSDSLATLSVNGTIVRGNRAGAGGGTHSRNCATSLTHSQLTNNHATRASTSITTDDVPYGGGGVYVAAPSLVPGQTVVLHLDATRIIACSSASEGGGMKIILPHSTTSAQHVDWSASSVVLQCTALSGGGGGVFSNTPLKGSTPSPLRVLGNHAIFSAEWGTDPAMLVLLHNSVSTFEQLSDEYFRGDLLLAVEDHYGHVVATEHSMLLGVSSTDPAVTTFQGQSVVARAGVFNMTGRLSVRVDSQNTSYSLAWQLAPSIPQLYGATDSVLPPPLSVRIGLCQPGAVWNGVRCTRCPRGAYTDTWGATECALCAKGKRAVVTIGSTSCTQCTPGKFAEVAGLTDCTLCPAGRAAPTPGAENCTLCEPGYFANSQGAPNCQRCVKGTFADTAGAVECSACSTDTHWVNYSAPCASCVGLQVVEGLKCVCPTGTVAWDVPELCIACSQIPGARCTSNHSDVQPAELEAAPGFWQDPVSHHKFYSCPFPLSCKPDGCEEGSEGPCCLACASGHYRGMLGYCQVCPRSSILATSAVTLFFAIVVMVLVYYYMKRLRADSKQRAPGQRSLRRDVTALAKIVISHLQMLSLVVLVKSSASTFSTDNRSATDNGEGQGGFPAAMYKLTLYLSLGLLRVLRVTPLPCVTESPALAHVLFAFLLPLVLAGLVAGVAAVITVLAHFRRQVMDRFSHLRQRGINAVCVLLLLVYPSVTQELLLGFRHLRCGGMLDTVGLDGGAVVGSVQYTAIQGISTAGLVLFTATLPCAFALILVRNRLYLYSTQHQLVRLKYSFLYQGFKRDRWWFGPVVMISPGFKRDRWWFGPVVMIEKAVLAVVSVFLSDAPLFQYSLAAVLIVLSLITLALVKPYHGVEQHLAMFSRLVLFLTLQGAIVLASSPLTDAYSYVRVDVDTLTGFMVGLNLLAVGLPLCFLVYTLQKRLSPLAKGWASSVNVQLSQWLLTPHSSSRSVSISSNSRSSLSSSESVSLLDDATHSSLEEEEQRVSVVSSSSSSTPNT